MPWSRPLILGLLVVALALAWWRLHPAEPELRRSRLLMGTVIEIVVAREGAADPDAAVAAAFAEMERLDRLLSRHRPESEVSRFSQSPGPATVSAETAEVIALGLEVARRSEGAFDLTLGRLKALWALDSAEPRVPTATEIAAALEDAGPEALVQAGTRVSKARPDLQLDLGGVAKGYAVDRAIAVLREHGVAAAAVNAGGDMYLLGRRFGRPWRVGIQHPRRADAVLETVQVSDRAVVTSGDYERFFEQDGRRYHHLFDPRSGYPAAGCQSVTVIAGKVALADALATAAFVLGPERGLRLLEGEPDVEGLLVAADGTRHATAGWAAFRAAP